MSKYPIEWDRTFDKDKKYIWISEKKENTCADCKSLDGKIFSGDKVPLRPHPNCKCEVKEYTGNNQNKFLNNEKKQEILFELYEIIGQITIIKNDLNILKIYNVELISIKEKIEEIENLIIELNEKLNNSNIYDLEYKTINIQIKYIQSQVRDIFKQIPLNTVVKHQIFEHIASVKDDYNYNNIIMLSDLLLHDAVSLWNIAYTKFDSKKAFDYISKNGELIYKVKDIKDSRLRSFIQKKVQQQLNTNESKGIIFHENSSISQSLIQNNNFIKKLVEHINKNKLIFKRYSDDFSVDRLNDWNLDNALGKFDVIDIHIDNNNNLCALVVDTYDFNKKDGNPLVIRGRKIQEKGDMENYYTITIIKIPLLKWKDFWK